MIEPADSGLLKRSVVILNQIRSVDRQRLRKRIGHLSDENMRRVDEVLTMSLGLLQF